MMKSKMAITGSGGSLAAGRGRLAVETALPLEIGFLSPDWMGVEQAWFFGD